MTFLRIIRLLRVMRMIRLLRFLRAAGLDEPIQSCALWGSDRGWGSQHFGGCAMAMLECRTGLTRPARLANITYVLPSRRLGPIS